jgi:fatty acid desaturase
MLDLMQQIAVRFEPARSILIGLAGVGALAAGIALVAFEAAQGDLILLPALVVLLWAVLGVVFIDLFARIPKAPEAGERPWRRLIRKLSRSLYWILAVGFLMLGLIALDVSFSIAREWLDDRAPLQSGDR